jgi:hypothetical protein
MENLPLNRRTDLLPKYVIEESRCRKYKRLKLGGGQAYDRSCD